MSDNKEVAIACDLFLLFRKKFVERLLPNSKMKRIVVEIFDDVLDEILLDLSHQKK